MEVEETVFKAKLKDVSALRLYVRMHGYVPSSGKLARHIGQTRQRISRRWGTWEALYKAAGFERPDGRGDYRRGRDLTEEHKRRISEGVRRSWEQRKEEAT